MERQRVGLVVGQFVIGRQHDLDVNFGTIHGVYALFASKFVACFSNPRSVPINPRLRALPWLSTRKSFCSAFSRNAAPVYRAPDNWPRNFFVARKRVFLAVSSVVFNISPIVLRRRPW